MAIHKETALQISHALPHGWRAVAIPNGGKRGAFEAKLLKDMGASAGFPDLMILGQHDDRRPVAYFIEVKVPDKYSRLSDPQKEWRDALKDMGHPWGEVRSLDDLYALGITWGWPWRVKMTLAKSP
jgi:hypothetical protein